MIPAALQAKPGEKILPKFKELVRWIDSQRLISVDERVLINSTINGSLVAMVDKAPSILTPLQVRFSGDKLFSVGEGYVNGRLPKIRPNQGDLQELVDPDGVPAPPKKLPLERPLLVCAEVVFDKEFKLESCEIVTKEPKEIPRTGSANLAIKAEKMTGLIPLAYIRKNIIFQFVTHNLQVRAFEYNQIKTIIYWPS